MSKHWPLWYATNNWQKIKCVCTYLSTSKLNTLETNLLPLISYKTYSNSFNNSYRTNIFIVIFMKCILIYSLLFLWNSFLGSTNTHTVNLLLFMKFVIWDDVQYNFPLVIWHAFASISSKDIQKEFQKITFCLDYAAHLHAFHGICEWIKSDQYWNWKWKFKVFFKIIIISKPFYKYVKSKVNLGTVALFMISKWICQAQNINQLDIWQPLHSYKSCWLGISETISL